MCTEEPTIAGGIAAAEARGDAIDDLTARSIANRWKDGQADALRASLSTGAITRALVEEIRRAADGAAWDDDELAALEEYAIAVGERGPQPGWPPLPH